MKKAKLVSIVLISLLTINLKAQDTLKVSTREKFESLIQYGFILKNEGLVWSLRRKLKKEFRSFNFDLPEYDCNYMFSYNISLDSMGCIINCSTHRENFKDSILNSLESNMAKIISDYDKLLIRNYVQLEDTSYFLHNLPVIIEMSCYPRKLLFTKNNIRKRNIKVLYFNDENKFLTFHGFQFWCPKTL